MSNTPWRYSHVPIEDAYQRVGLRCKSKTIRYSPCPDATMPFALVVFWPRLQPYSENPQGHSYLKVNAWHGEAKTKFGTIEDLSQIYEQMGRPYDVPTADEQDRNEYRIAYLPGEDLITLEFRLDTDDLGFVQAADGFESVFRSGKKPTPLLQTVSVLALSYDPRFDDAIDITVEFTPGFFPEYDHGDLAIDLGNTNSAVAYLPVEAKGSEQIEVLDVNGHPCPECPEDCKHSVLASDAPPVESNVQLTHVLRDPETHAWTDLSLALSSARWNVGAVQHNEDHDGLFMGVKRLLAAHNESLLYAKVHPDLHAEKESPREPLDVDPRLPAELFLCRLFQRFREAQRTNARCFAVTYPTTYSRRELERVREATYRGWLQANDLPPPDNLAQDERAKVHVARMLDEASAAGFFFLYRHVFERPHGLARFRYLYPNGFNLLLYDCGGGTTDIALLRAEVHREPVRPPANKPPAKPGTKEVPVAQERPALSVHVSVLGRSGEREFGGDNITEDIFRLIKVKLAEAMIQGTPSLAPRFSGAKPTLPKDVKKLREFLDHEPTQKYFDQVLRTTFEPAEHDDVHNEAARRRTLELWALAEEVKRNFCLKKNEEFPSEVKLPPLGETTTLRLTLNRPKVADISGIKVDRAEVDALIQPRLRASIERCNRLIWDKLLPAKQEVHSVVMAGKATLYPLFADEIQHLTVRYLDARLEKFDTEAKQANLKFAVAKGAVLALCKDRLAGNVAVRFTEDLPDKIPFNLGYKEEEFKHVLPILSEGNRYDSLAKGSEPLILHVEPDQEKRITLYRRWPGDEAGKEDDLDEGYKPYLTFLFEEGIQPPVKVFYDTETQEFVVRDKNKDGVLVESEVPPDCSPPQRGTL